MAVISSIRVGFVLTWGLSSMGLVQLDLFQEVTEQDVIRRELGEMRERGENVRKGIFARHSALAKLYMDLSDRFSKLEAEFQKVKR